MTLPWTAFPLPSPSNAWHSRIETAFQCRSCRFLSSSLWVTLPLKWPVMTGKTWAPGAQICLSPGKGLWSLAKAGLNSAVISAVSDLPAPSAGEWNRAAQSWTQLIHSAALSKAPLGNSTGGLWRFGLIKPEAAQTGGEAAVKPTPPQLCNSQGTTKQSSLSTLLSAFLNRAASPWL